MGTIREQVSGFPIVRAESPYWEGSLTDIAVGESTALLPCRNEICSMFGEVFASAARSSIDMAATIRVGISGWRYAPWRGKFYPRGLVQDRELEYASRCFTAIEINGSFYSLQRPKNYEEWYAATPPGFVFAVKGGRYITHMLKLREVKEPLANFLASGVFALREKLGPVLWQLPPQFKYDRGRVEAFLDLLPHDTATASRLARGRSARMKGRTRLAIDENRPLRHALEIRHESFLYPSFFELLSAHGVAFVVAETAGRWPLFFDATADFVYIRLHGDKELYRSGYGVTALERWAGRIRDWSMGREPPGARIAPNTAAGRSKGREVYCFFDNTDAKLRAPQDAQALMSLSGISPLSRSAPHPSSSPRSQRPKRGTTSGLQLARPLQPR